MRAFERRSKYSTIVIVEHDGVFYGLDGNRMEKLQDTLQKNWRESVESIALGLSPTWKPV